MSLKSQAPFGVGTKSKAVVSYLSGEGYSLKLGSVSFGSPVNSSAVNNPIFYINATEYKNKFHSLKKEQDHKRISLK